MKYLSNEITLKTFEVRRRGYIMHKNSQKTRKLAIHR